jgi:hypothetical protein
MYFELRVLTSFTKQQLNKQIWAFITFIAGSELSYLSPGHITTDTHKMRNLVGSRPGVDSQENRKVFLQETEITMPVTQPLA